MSGGTAAAGAVTAARRAVRRSRRLPPLLLVGAGIVAALALVAVLASVLAPYPPEATSGPALASPSAAHLLGTNDIGQDVLSQLIWGARSSLLVSAGAAAIAVVVAALVGVTAGLLGGVLDALTMRAVDLLLAVPVLPLLIVVAALAGSHLLVVVLTLGMIGWPQQARVLRAQVLSLRQRGFVTAAKGFGFGPLGVARRHLLPALGPLVAAGFVNWVAVVLGLQAALAVLGLANPSQVSWGSMINEAFTHSGLFFGLAWAWWLLPAATALIVAVLGFAFVGVGLEPSLNPRTEIRA